MQDNARDSDRVNSVNVRYVRQQGDRHNRRYSDRGQHNEGGRSFHRRGQGSLREDRGSQLNPIAPNFHPRDNAPQRSQDSQLSAETTDSGPQPLNN